MPGGAACRSLGGAPGAKAVERGGESEGGKSECGLWGSADCGPTGPDLAVGPDSMTATQPEFMIGGKLVNLSEPQPPRLLTTVPASQEAGRLHPLTCINHTGQYLAYDVYNDSCYLS